MYLDPIYYHRKNQEVSATAADVLSTLCHVEINPVELCTRTCVFCPRSDAAIYPNRKLFMSIETATALADGLAEFNFGATGQSISISGFGEPLLNPHLAEIVQTLRQRLPSAYIELINNGDLLTEKKITQLIAAGLNMIMVNLYDGPEQIEKFETMFKEAHTSTFLLRHHYLGQEQSYGLTLNNRSGMVSNMPKPDEPIQRPCFVPFYKMMIDWNGDVLLCFNDWGRKATSPGNVNQKSVRQLWLSDEMRFYREHLLKSDRSLAPCNSCDIDGTLHGQSSFEAFQEFYSS